MKRRSAHLLVSLGLVAMAAAGQMRVKGRVTDENNTPVADAGISLTPADDSDDPAVEATSDQTGNFTIQVPGIGNYLVGAEHEGYFAVRDRPVRIAQSGQDLHVVLNCLRGVKESVTVKANNSLIDMDRTSPERKLTAAQIIDIPYPKSGDLRSSMRLLPGMAKDANGGVHLQGGAEDQVTYTLDGFDLNDPLTGQFESEVSVEAIRTMEVSSGRFPAEFGKGSAGVLALRTSSGDDQLRYTATNFVPGVQGHKGLQLGNWSPRANLSGPIRRGRAWFSDSVDLNYERHIIEELPKGQDRTITWQVSNLLRSQVNITPSNILSTGLLVNYSLSPRTGLSLLDPVSTTVDRGAHQYFFDVKDQAYLARGMLLEFGYAAHRTFGSERPQATGILIITPEVKRGNYYVNAMRKGERDQWLTNAFLPSFNFGGKHQLKAGIDLDRVNYWQDVHRTGYEEERYDGSLQRRVTFLGNGTFGRSNFEASAFLQDSWKVRTSLLIEAGLRQDWDRLARNLSLSPRLGFGWSPFHSRHTKISGGYAVIYDATGLRLFTRPLDQYSMTTMFNPDGTVQYGPAATVFTITSPRLKAPRYHNWSLGVEQQLPGNFYLAGSVLRKRGHDGFTFSNMLEHEPAPAGIVSAVGTSQFMSIYNLDNRRRDVYDAFGVTLRKTFGTGYEVMGNYTYSRALSNAAVDINVDDPVIILDNAGRMPWDSPNRVMSWGYLPTPLKNWSVAYMMDWHTGYPYSLQDTEGRVTGPVNSHRLPNFFELNVHIERRFTFHGQLWAWRAGANNITNSKNPALVYSILGSPHYGQFYGTAGRVFNVRIRWLGKA